MKIPFMEESKELVKRATKLIGDRFVGWDVGITENGPILIEGNSKPHIGISDMAYGGYLSNPIFKEVVDKYIAE